MQEDGWKTNKAAGRPWFRDYGRNKRQGRAAVQQKMCVGTGAKQGIIGAVFRAQGVNCCGTSVGVAATTDMTSYPHTDTTLQ